MENIKIYVNIKYILLYKIKINTLKLYKCKIYFYYINKRYK